MKYEYNGHVVTITTDNDSMRVVGIIPPSRVKGFVRASHTTHRKVTFFELQHVRVFIRTGKGAIIIGEDV
jgi:hypothetical protein